MSGAKPGAAALHFVGVGSAQAVELGSSCAVLELDGEPRLMIDCGPEALTAFLAAYQQSPPAIFLTHAHLDHVGGLERLFGRNYFDADWRGRTRLYIGAELVPLVQQRIADYPNVLAEGGVNFWDAFQLVAVSRHFWHAGIRFEVFPTRHHAPAPSFGLAWRGAFVYTGDTRPIPGQLAPFDAGATLIAHECGLVGNPSHTGLDDLAREYPQSLRERFVLYHYGSGADGEVLKAAGYRIATPGARFDLQGGVRLDP